MKKARPKQLAKPYTRRYNNFSNIPRALDHRETSQCLNNIHRRGEKERRVRIFVIVSCAGTHTRVMNSISVRGAAGFASPFLPEKSINKCTRALQNRKKQQPPRVSSTHSCRFFPLPRSRPLARRSNKCRTARIAPRAFFSLLSLFFVLSSSLLLHAFSLLPFFFISICFLCSSSPAYNLLVAPFLHPTISSSVHVRIYTHLPLPLPLSLFLFGCHFRPSCDIPLSLSLTLRRCRCRFLFSLFPSRARAHIGFITCLARLSCPYGYPLLYWQYISYVFPFCRARLHYEKMSSYS